MKYNTCEPLETMQLCNITLGNLKARRNPYDFYAEASPFRQPSTPSLEQPVEVLYKVEERTDYGAVACRQRQLLSLG